MKNITINTAAEWVTTLLAPQDGDKARELTFWDLLFTRIGDQLGALKTMVDGKASLSGDNEWSGTQTFRTIDGPITFVEDDYDVEFQAPIVAQNSTFNDVSQFNGPTYLFGGIALTPQALPDAASAIAVTTFHARVPVITANRVYTLPSTAGLPDGWTIRLERLDISSAWSATLQDPTGPTTMGIVGASAQGWVEVIKRGSNWRVSAWGGSVTSLHSTP